jgi:hypothetical protein
MSLLQGAGGWWRATIWGSCCMPMKENATFTEKTDSRDPRLPKTGNYSYSFKGIRWPGGSQLSISGLSMNLLFATSPNTVILFLTVS